MVVVPVVAAMPVVAVVVPVESCRELFLIYSQELIQLQLAPVEGVALHLNLPQELMVGIVRLQFLVQKEEQ
tara:strand:+ start:25 stop:237 length:213 start_codon:yes stop_codon:yes gene_type:complete